MRSKQEKKRVLQELEELAPGLAQLKANEKPPDIPAHYFEQLPDQVFLRIRETQAEPGRRRGAMLWQQFWQQIRLVFFQRAYATALAGLAVVIIGLTVLLREQNSGATDTAALSDDDIIQYIDYHIDDFDLGLLMEATGQGSLEEETLMGEDSLEEREMEDYLEELLDEVDLEELL